MRRTTRAVDRRAAGAAIGAGILTTVAVYSGSRGLMNFDVALVGYAIATVLMISGLVFRTMVWLSHPPARRIFRRAFSGAAGRRAPGRVATAVKAGVDNLVLQSFLRRRGVVRWAAHQCLVWGVLLAVLVTFPLTFGWVRFGAGMGASEYVPYVIGLALGSFDAHSILGWLTFHVLDVAAVLVLAGCGYFLGRRARGGRDGRTGFHTFPLLVLVAISLTGLALTFSTEFLAGRYYRAIALTHMSVVGLGLVMVPFSKLFHPIQRPAGVGVEMTRGAEPPARCRCCGEPLAVAGPVEDLQATMAELNLGLGRVADLCGACKRVTRGAAYRDHVKAGYR